MSRNSFHAAVCGALFLVLGGSVTAFADESQSKQPQQGLRVTYLLFSGRPNPTVTVTDPAQVRAIEEKLASARASGRRADARAGHSVLGYNGIMVERLGATAAASRFVVKRDVLRAEASAEKSGAADAESTATVSSSASDLETLLLSVGQEQGVIDEVMLSVVQSSN